MSSVYGAVFMWLLATILWWSGWREETTQGIPHWAVGIFLSVWPLALLLDITVIPSLSLNGAWIWTLLSMIALAWIVPPARRWTAISAGVFMGSLYVLISRIADSPAGLSHYFTPWAAAIVVGWLAALFIRQVSGQVLAITSGMILSELISLLTQASSDTVPIFIKASEWMEKWWIAVLFARLWSVMVKALVETVKKQAFKLESKRGGNRS